MKGTDVDREINSPGNLAKKPHLCGSLRAMVTKVLLEL